MDRLTIRNSDGSVSQPTQLRWADALEKLADYEDIDEAGLLMRLPCKPGDTVMAYLDGPTLILSECVITRIEYSTDYREPLFTAVCYAEAKYNTFWLSDFGKEVFTLEQYWTMKPGGQHEKTDNTKRGRVFPKP